MTSRFSPLLVPALAAALAATGCNFAVDADLVEPNPVTSDDAGTPEGDGGLPCEGLGCSGGDGDMPDGGDGDMPDVGDGDACTGSACVPEPVACTGDQQCKDDQYCSQESKVCKPRCTEELGCAGPAVDEESRVFSDAERVYWITAPREDNLGNKVDRGSVWAWEANAAPQRVADHSDDFSGAVIDDYLYFKTADGLEGRPVFGQGDIIKLAKATSVWTTHDHFWWSVQLGPDSAELWRRPRAAQGPDELMGTGAHAGWTTGTKTHVARWIETSAVYVAAIEDLANEKKNEFMDSFVQADETHMYLDGMGGIFRFDPRMPEMKTRLAPNLDDMDWSFLQLRGDWAYWRLSGWDDGATTFGRTPVGLQTEYEVLSLPAAAAAARGTVFKHQLVYVHPQESRVFVLPLPPPPCSAALPCSDGLSCVDSLCK